jgi:TonB family protein
MTHNLPILRSLLRVSMFAFLLSLSLPPTLPAQTPPPPADPSISKLSGRLARPLEKLQITKIIVADLKGPDHQLHPLGKWLADRLSESLSNGFPDLLTIPRPQNQDAPSGVDAADDPKQEKETAKDWARQLGANVVITGTFSKWADGVGISLEPLFVSDTMQFDGPVAGIVPVSEAMTALSPDPIPSPKVGVLRAGVGGATIPKCVYCPVPSYTNEARAAKVMGSVVLQTTVTAEGTATKFIISRDPGKGLGAQAIDSVRKWKFEPALGPDGKPIDVICPIEVTFRLY